MTGPVPSYVRRRRAARKLRAAADLLATNGWIQGQPSDGKGRHCVIGALNTVTEDDDGQLWEDAYGAVRKHLDHQGLASWNDRSGRTAEQVIAVLRETAAEEDARAAALEAESRPAGELPTRAEGEK